MPPNVLAVFRVSVPALPAVLANCAVEAPVRGLANTMLFVPVVKLTLVDPVRGAKRPERSCVFTPRQVRKTLVPRNEIDPSVRLDPSEFWLNCKSTPLEPVLLMTVGPVYDEPLAPLTTMGETLLPPEPEKVVV